MTIPSIDGALYSHYLRGYFDGDGSIYSSKKTNLPSSYSCSICGAYKSIDAISSVLNANKINHTVGLDNRTHKYKDVFKNIKFNSVPMVYDFLKFIYKDSNGLYMNRKANKTKEFLNSLSNSKYEKYRRLEIWKM